MVSTDLVIETRGLVKTFGSVRALDGLDLCVAAGEVHGFLGPNGAGKSTTIRALLGLLRTDGGMATVFGLDPWRDTVAIHRRLAYVPGDVACGPTCPAARRSTCCCGCAGRRRSPRGEPSCSSGSTLDPTKKGRAYSKGNRQKVALVAAFARRRRPADPGRADVAGSTR